MSIISPDRINVKGGKGFSRSGIAKVTKPMPAKSVAPPIATKGLTKRLMTMDKRAPFGNKFFLGQDPQQFGKFPKLRKKPMKKTAAIYRMPKPRLPSARSVIYGKRSSSRLIKKPRRGSKPKVPNFMKGIVGFKQLPTYKSMKSPMTKYLKKRFKF